MKINTLTQPKSHEFFIIFDSLNFNHRLDFWILRLQRGRIDPYIAGACHHFCLIEIDRRTGSLA